MSANAQGSKCESNNLQHKLDDLKSPESTSRNLRTMLTVFPNNCLFCLLGSKVQDSSHRRGYKIQHPRDLSEAHNRPSPGSPSTLSNPAACWMKASKILENDISTASAHRELRATEVPSEPPTQSCASFTALHS